MSIPTPLPSNLPTTTGPRTYAEKVRVGFFRKWEHRLLEDLSSCPGNATYVCDSYDNIDYIAEGHYKRAAIPYIRDWLLPWCSEMGIQVTADDRYRWFTVSIPLK